MSVVILNKNEMGFDVVEETWKKTNLGSMEKGDRVNLERAMLAGARLDGHIVQGHIEGVATVIESGDTLKIDVPTHLLASIVEKGSIAIDGVSLTIAKIEQNTCSIALIPHTIASTTLGSLKPQDTVNIETDFLLRSHHV